MISLHPEPRKAVSNHAFMQIFGCTFRFPKEILALPKESIFSPNGILALSKKIFFSLKGDYYLPPKGEMTLDKVFRSPYGKLNTPSHFDSRTFSGNCKLNSLLTSSYKCEDSCTWFLRLIAVWTYHEKRTHPPVDSVKRLESFHSTWLWQIKEFSGDPVASKILEHIVHSFIMKHLNDHNILTDCQHGFRAKRSSEMQLILTLHDMAKAIHSSSIHAAILDFAKAFVKVPHSQEALSRRALIFHFR